MQENTNTGKPLPLQDTAGKENITANKPAGTVITSKKTKQHKAEVEDEVKESFKEEDNPAGTSFGNDGFEVGGEGG